MNTPPTLSRRAAFTLVEMLTVIAIIAILAGITFGLTRGVSSQQALSQARAELSQITMALEAFKQYYGDYPQLTLANGRNLGGFLGGLRVPTGSGVGGSVPSSDAYRSFLDLGKMTTATVGGTTNVLVDPWGEPYEYVYRPVLSSWQPYGFVLYSRGPDRRHNAGSVNTNGILDRTHNDNLDNVFPNES